MKVGRIIIPVVLLLILSSKSILAAFPPLIDGAVFDNNTLEGRSDVYVNITGSVSGFIYSGTSYGVTPNPGNPHGAGYSSGTNITYVAGERITVQSINSQLTGYTGSSYYDTQPGDTVITIDLPSHDIARPEYYDVVMRSSAIRRGVQGIVADVSWKDNSGRLSLAVEHNGTGVWENYTVVLNESLNTDPPSKSVFHMGKRISAFVDTTNISRGTEAFWKLVAWDMSGNVNDAFPMNNSFTVLNGLPVVQSVQLTPSYPYVNSTIDCSVLASDVDGDNVTLYYRWFVGGSQLNYTNTSLGLGNFTVGDVVSCQVTPFDGFENGSYSTASIQINPFGTILFQNTIRSGWNLISLPINPLD